MLNCTTHHVIGRLKPLLSAAAYSPGELLGELLEFLASMLAR